MEMIIGILLVFMIIGSIICLETKDLLSAIIAIVPVGYFSGIIFLLLGAPDIAITQMVVEVLSLIILIRATIRRDLTTIEEERDFFGLITTFAFIFVFFIFGIEAMKNLPSFGTPSFTLNPSSPSNRYLLNGLKETGAANVVSAIILDYRGYDTLGEATILFTSILGALAILRVYARKRSKNE
jgi:multisubunit Na+/H+ antiporter MnhB subunit